MPSLAALDSSSSSGGVSSCGASSCGASSWPLRSPDFVQCLHGRGSASGPLAWNRLGRGPATPVSRLCNRSTRVKAYLGFGGTQVCLAGVGERANFGTFPRSWTAGDMMDTSGWIEILKCPEENERPKVGEHYNLIEPPCWRPKGVVFHRTFPQKSLICVRNDEIGWLTDYITLMNTKGTIAFEEPEDPSDNDSVKTPDTPDGYVSPPYW